MTLLWFDGFEGRDRVSFYGFGNFGGNTFDTSTALSYGVALGNSSGTGDRRVGRAVTASSQIFAGGRFKVATAGDSLLSFWADTGTVQHVTIKTNASLGIDICRGASTVLASSANGVVSTGTWFYLEASATLNDTTGAVDVRLNGSGSSLVSFSGDTKNAGTSSNIDTVEWHVGGTGGRFDDVYVCNSSGSVNNTFLGDMRVQTLFPDGAGTTTGLTPSTGTNWQNVDETVASSTDYNGSAVSGTRDTYTIQDLAAGSAGIKGTRTSVSMHKSDAGASSMKAALRVGSTVYYESTETLNTSITDYTYTVRETSPDTSTTWTVSEVNATEVGAEVV